MVCGIQQTATGTPTPTNFLIDGSTNPNWNLGGYSFGPNPNDGTCSAITSFTYSLHINADFSDSVASWTVSMSITPELLISNPIVAERSTVQTK